ncbi:MAG: ATP-binding protein [Sulfurospirillum sp.]|nr:ATP-binding protein [Sulfurospirillum sp.]
MNIGKIISINFNQFKVKIFSEITGGLVNINGDIYYFGNIGSYLKTTNAVGEHIICEVVSIFDSDSYNEQKAFNVDGHRELMLKPIGIIDTAEKFSLGVGIYPCLYSDVNIVKSDDMEKILGTIDSSIDHIHKSFDLGISKNLINYPISISIDNFFNIHSAVLGNSGSGKSNTIAHILQNIYRKNNNSAKGSRVILFDVNGEYAKAFPKNLNANIKIKYYKPNIISDISDKSNEIDYYENFFMPHFLMTLDEWSAFLLATDVTQRPFWDKVLQETYRFYKIATAQDEESRIYINYLRYKLCELLFNILSQADTDTSRITTAGASILKIKSIIDSNTNLRTKCKKESLCDDINNLHSKCTINYGNNNDNLNDEVKEVNKKVNYAEVQKILDERIQNGEFFDYKFLKISAEMALLEEDARANRQMRGYTATMMTRLDYFLDNYECKFMRDIPEGVTNPTTYLEYIWGKDTDKTQLIIIDTSELGIDILETLTSVISRLIFAQRKALQNDKRREKPVHLVLDEAHRYIKKDFKYLLRENIFERIAREGRKYSLFLLISSQRPSELSETVLSQCSNFIIHRIQNEIDMRYINAVLPYFSDDFVNKIKQSTPGEALVFGNCVSMPLHVAITKSEPEPNSKNCTISKEWFKN